MYTEHKAEQYSWYLEGFQTVLHFRHVVFHLKMYFNIIMDFPQLSTHTTIIPQYMKSGVLSAL